jgi:hypothetical protein
MLCSKWSLKDRAVKDDLGEPRLRASKRGGDNSLGWKTQRRCALSSVIMTRTRTILTAEEIEEIRIRTARAIAPLKPPENGRKYTWGDTRTNGGRSLPVYYLVYFLLVDLLKFPKGGAWEKVAWSIPVDFNGSAAVIEHRKMGLGVFSSTKPEDEAIAEGIVAAVKRGVGAARPFFDQVAAKAVGGKHLNVTNNGPWLFSRYTYLRDQFREKLAAAKNPSFRDVVVEENTGPRGKSIKSYTPRYSDTQEARWVGIAAIGAFFSWTEHVLIHIAILLGKLKTGDDVTALADAEWSDKVKKAIDLAAEKEMKDVYEELLEIRRQVRNYMAHGAFGKNGEAFRFHSGAGAVPVNIGSDRFSMLFSQNFEESRAVDTMESFIEKLWQGERAPAKAFLEDDLPVILTHASDGIYKTAMSSEEMMADYIKYLTREVDNAANMDW